MTGYLDQQHGRKFRDKVFTFSATWAAFLHTAHAQPLRHMVVAAPEGLNLIYFG